MVGRSNADMYPAFGWEHFLSRALMGSAHASLNNPAVSKTLPLTRFLACRSDLSAITSSSLPATVGDDGRL